MPRRNRERGCSSLKAMVEESIGERERKRFEGLNSKVNLSFGKAVQFKYLHGLSDAGT